MGRIEAITRALSNLKKVGSKCKPEPEEGDTYGKQRRGSPVKSTGASKATVYSSLSRGDPLFKVWRQHSSHKAGCQQFLAPGEQSTQDEDENEQVGKPCEGRPCSPTCCKVALHVPGVASSTSSIDSTTPFSSGNVSIIFSRVSSTKAAIGTSDTVLHHSPRRLSSSSSSGVALKPSQLSILGGSKRARCSADSSPNCAQALVVGSSSLSSGGTGGYGCVEDGLQQCLPAAGSMPSASHRPSTSDSAGNVAVSASTLLRRQSSALSNLGDLCPSAASASTLPITGCGAKAGVRLPALRPASYPLPQPPPLAKPPRSAPPAAPMCSDGVSPDIRITAVRSATGHGTLTDAAAVLGSVAPRDSGCGGQVAQDSFPSGGSCPTRATRILVARNLDSPSQSPRLYTPQPPATPPPAHYHQHAPAAPMSPATANAQEQDPRPRATMLLASLAERPDSATAAATPRRRAGSVTGMHHAHEGLGGWPPHPPRTAPPSATAAGAAAAQELRASAYICGAGSLVQAGVSLGSLRAKALCRVGGRSFTATGVREALMDGGRTEGGNGSVVAGGGAQTRARGRGDDGENTGSGGSCGDDGGSGSRGCSASSVDDSIAFDIVQGAGRWFDAGDLAYCNPESEDVMSRIMEDLFCAEVPQRHRLKGSIGAASRSLTNISGFYPAADVPTKSPAAAAAAADRCASRRRRPDGRASTDMLITQSCMAPLPRQGPYTADSHVTPLDATKHPSSQKEAQHQQQPQPQQVQQPQLLPPRCPSDGTCRPATACGVAASGLQSGSCNSGGCDGIYRSSESLVPRLHLPVVSGGGSSGRATRVLAISPLPSGPQGPVAATLSQRNCFGTTGIQAPCLQVVDMEGRQLHEPDHCGNSHTSGASGGGGGSKPLSGQSQRWGSQLLVQAAGRRATQALGWGPTPAAPAPALASGVDGTSATYTRFDRMWKGPSFSNSLEAGRC